MQTRYEEDIGFSDYHPPDIDFFEEVILGLKQTPKSIPPKFFYDAVGSRLFDQICELEEYYPTRTEVAILRNNADDIAKTVGDVSLIIEPGSGSSTKVRLLLEAIKPNAYMPMDISKQHLIQSAQKIANDYPWLDVHAACADYTTELQLPDRNTKGHSVAFFPGSSIGNFEPAEAVSFLNHLGKILGKDGGILIGVDLKKSRHLFHSAYNDRQSITAQFNKNLLHRINDELTANFDPDLFVHNAFYNDEKGRVEMHLVSIEQQSVNVDGHIFHFEKEESIHTENSYKYTIDEFQSLGREAGFIPAKVWTDPDHLFSVHYFVREND